MFALKNFKTFSKFVPAEQQVAFRLSSSSNFNLSNAFGYRACQSFSSEQKLDPVYDIKNGEDWENKIMKNEKPVILDFHADWCGPCRILGPKLEERYANAEGKWAFAKCNIDEFKELAQALGIQSIPQVYLIHEGQIKEHFMGVIPDNELDEFVSKAVKLTEL